ncbi:MAG: D-alanine--D-alanine ligase [Lachnospiraceae bacterium]|nr:D-alanine--D-alanine ligase [Lachnospiraceae bacterium]
MKIVVLCGGLSTERDVSLISGKMVYQALLENGHQVILTDVFLGYPEPVEPEKAFEEDIDWFAVLPEFSGDFSIGKRKLDLSEVRSYRKDGGRSFFGPQVIPLCQAADIVFMALHGDCGENGKIQAAFDLCGIRYTGTDSLSSALAMDKSFTKYLFAAHQILSPAYHVLKDASEDYHPDFPCVVKVNSGGSSVGVYIVRDREAYEVAVREAFTYDHKVFVEEYIEGREFTDCVIEGEALPVVEIAPKSGFYDYKNKYEAGATEETCPAKISPALTKKIQEAAVKAYFALEIKTYARMDFRVDQNDNVYCLEANTLPGMTPTSLVPIEAAAIGKSFPALCDWILQISMDKYK